MKNNRVLAFTLSEVIIVLILTSIVIGLAFTVLGLVQKQMFAIQSNYNKNLEIKKFQTALWMDFNRYLTIQYNTFEDKMVLKNEIDSISYNFSKDYIVKEADTFNIQLKTKQFYFDGDLSNSNKLDAIKFTTTKAYQSQELFIFKKNDATSYMD